MPVMEKLKMFVVQEPVVAASCLIAGVGLALPAFVRPLLDSLETSKKVPQPDLNDVVAGMTDIPFPQEFWQMDPAAILSRASVHVSNLDT